jgi:hypothetical protein
MRTFLFCVLVVAGAGCGPAAQPPGSSGGYDQYGCKISCDKCPLQALCVPAPYVPMCLVQCATTADCDETGGKCAIMTTDIAPSVCVGPGVLMECDPPTACTAANECRDANTQLKPLPASYGCGWEVVHCDSGCDSATGSCK